MAPSTFKLLQVLCDAFFIKQLVLILEPLCSALQTIDDTFTLGEEYTISYFLNQGIMHMLCTQPHPNILHFYSYEPAKGWNITSEMTFSKDGMTNTQTYLNKNTSAKKFYAREKETEMK